VTEATLPIGALEMLLATGLVLVPAACSLVLRLGMGRQILVGTIRCCVQLLAVGYVLEYVFGLDQPWGVALVAAVMLSAAAHTVLGRVHVRYRGAVADTFLGLSVSAVAVLALTVTAIVQPAPWWSPRYTIPFLGMLLGNTMNGLSLGLGVWLESVRDHRERIESLLASGATRWEAAREGVAEAVRRGLTPILNAMAAAGLVSLPGMMTGQILAGNDPALAVRYQIVITFLIAATTSLGTLGVVLLAWRRLFDSEHRLRLDRLR
jgi:putative ABC transport system permease protein